MRAEGDRQIQPTGVIPGKLQVFVNRESEALRLGEAIRKRREPDDLRAGRNWENRCGVQPE